MAGVWRCSVKNFRRSAIPPIHHRKSTTYTSLLWSTRSKIQINREKKLDCKDNNILSLQSSPPCWFQQEACEASHVNLSWYYTTKKWELFENALRPVPWAKFSASLFIHGVDWYLPVLGGLLGVVRKIEICIIFFPCSNECFSTHHDKPFNHEQLVVVLNQGFQYVTIIWWVCQFVSAYTGQQ